MSAAEKIPTLYTEAEAARRLGVSKATLTRERIAGRIGAIRMGERIIRYTDEILSEYLRTCRSGSDKSETTGFPSDQGPTIGAGPGTTPTLDKRSAHQLAQATFKRRS